MAQITMTATYQTTVWESDEPDTEPTICGGFTDPSNPWGGFKCELPDGCVGEAAEAWMAENVETLTFDTVEEAAQFVADFPGGVWDYSASEPEMDHKTGVYMEVTLHVKGSAGGRRKNVFALAHKIEAERDRRLAEQRANRSAW